MARFCKPYMRTVETGNTTRSGGLPKAERAQLVEPTITKLGLSTGGSAGAGHSGGVCDWGGGRWGGAGGHAPVIGIQTWQVAGMSDTALPIQVCNCI